MRFLLLAIVSIAFFSCSTIRETHYFKDKIKPSASNNLSIESDVSNYYRVNIKGWAFLSSSRYVSGYFDQNIVNEYFNEVSQPEGARLFAVAKSTDSEEPLGNKPTVVTAEEDKTEPEGSPAVPEGTEDTTAENPELVSTPPLENKDEVQRMELVDSEPGSELVLILSTNAEAVSTEIKNMSTNKDLLKSLTVLAHKDKIKEANGIKVDLQETDNDIDIFITSVDAYLSAIDPESTTTPKDILFQLLKSELRDKGITRSFSDFNDLKEWYYENN